MNYQHQQYSPQGFSFLPPVVKNLLIINGLLFLATLAMSTQGIDLVKLLGLHYFTSERFQVYQFITHMFMHGGFNHVLFNMFALWMFGYMLENVWGSKRFLQYYIYTGIGAALIQLLVTYVRISVLESQMDPVQVATVLRDGLGVLDKGLNYSNGQMATLNAMINAPMVGASGAVFGILLAFGMMFPETKLYLYFLFPIKAKYFVIGYGLVELIFGIANRPDDNVARFAHLGGMIFGFILIKYWKRKGVY
ncbi:MAG: rhomboid family intramembrane serine protease [Bacteroidales bacterium]|nr:rhomboid family intramembrane serine protease [Bacteroidales bacterium]